MVAGVWDFLGLSSCGVVYNDALSDGNTQNQGCVLQSPQIPVMGCFFEIPIIVWHAWHALMFGLLFWIVCAFLDRNCDVDRFRRRSWIVLIMKRNETLCHSLSYTYFHPSTISIVSDDQARWKSFRFKRWQRRLRAALEPADGASLRLNSQRSCAGFHFHADNSLVLSGHPVLYFRTVDLFFDAGEATAQGIGDKSSAQFRLRMSIC